MILEIHLSEYDPLVVHDCPPAKYKCDTLRIQIIDDGYEMSIHMDCITDSNVCKSVKQFGDGVIGAFHHAVCYPKELTADYIVLIRKVLGFSLLYNDTDGKKVYARELDFGTYEEFNLRRKPVDRIKLYGVNIPKAYVKLMKTITDLNEINSMTGDSLTEPDIPYSDDVVCTALNKLADLHAHDFTGPDAMVYDFLGCLELFTMDPMFIYGDELLPDTINNRMRSGSIDFYTMKMYDNVRRFKLSLDVCSDNVPDAFIEVTVEYRELHKKYYDKLKDNRVFSRALNILSKNAGL